MIEEKIDEEIASPYCQPILTGDECEAHAKLQEKASQVRQQAPFQFSFSNVSAEQKKIEGIGILGDLLREVRLRRWQGFVEVGDGFARALM